MNSKDALDVPYFKSKLECVLRDITRYTPSELSRELIRLARTAHEDIMMLECALIARQQIKDRVEKNRAQTKD